MKRILVAGMCQRMGINNNTMNIKNMFKIKYKLSRRKKKNQDLQVIKKIELILMKKANLIQNLLLKIKICSNSRVSIKNIMTS